MTRDTLAAISGLFAAAPDQTSAGRPVPVGRFDRAGPMVGHPCDGGGSEPPQGV